MIITLKKVTFSAALSEETSAFSATVCVDGVPAFVASNDGHGGCNKYDPIVGPGGLTLAQAGPAYKLMRSKLDEIAAYAKTLPPDVFHGLTLPQSTDRLVDNALTAWLVDRDAKKFVRKMTTRTLTVEVRNNKPSLIEYKSVGSDFVPAQIRAIRIKYPAAIVLNEMAPDKALELIRKTISQTNEA